MSSYPESDPLPPYEKVPKAPTPQPQPQPPPTTHPGSGAPRANPYGNNYQMYPYANASQNPRTICDTMGHQQVTQFGLAGVLTAIFCFPFGFLCCLLDRRVYCARCGAYISGPC